MVKSFYNRNIFDGLLFLLYLLFFIGLICAFPAISSISIGLILLTGIAKNKIEQGTFFNKKIINVLSVSCAVFYAFQFVGLLYTKNTNEGWQHLQLKSSLIFMPLALCCCDYIEQNSRQKLLSSYSLLLLAASFFCLIVATINFLNKHDSSVFFYFSLIKPFSQHAIIFSIMVFIALLHLFERVKTKIFIFKKSFHVSMIIVFSFFLLLLSSKLVIIFYIIYLIYYVSTLFRRKNTNRFMVVTLILMFLFCSGLVFTKQNPISKRFSEIIHSDLTILRQEKFDQGDYFNGLQFRLLQWRFVPEILNEKKSWLFGIGPGDAQFYLDNKYISEKMYTGDPARGDHGFLGYKTHNEFLEALLQSGIIGLMLFLCICFSLIRMALQKKNAELSFTIVLLLLFTFTESVFETQYGLILFTFFPLFFYLEKGKAE